MSDRPGWIGPIFAERYHLHALATPTEIAHCLEYLFMNAAKHFGAMNVVRCKITGSSTRARYIEVDAFTSFAELHTSADPPLARPRGSCLKREMRKKGWAARA